jgi:hypothetical protein
MTPRPVALCLVATALLAGCADLDGAARASAECGSAVHDDLGLGENDTALHTDTEVVESGDGRHVNGSWTHPDEGQGTFSCDVVPDQHRLRGWRVTGLDVERTG